MSNEKIYSPKTFPLSPEELREVIKKFPTPFHIYDEREIKNNLNRLQETFSWAPDFREHFAVKATPNPHIVKILADEGAGTDCSSLPELLISEKAGVTGEKIILTSNARRRISKSNSTRRDYQSGRHHPHRISGKKCRTSEMPFLPLQSGGHHERRQRHYRQTG